MNRTKSIKLLHSDLNNELRIDKKHIEALCDACLKLITICNKKELKVSDLKWQPHYSTVFKQIKSQLESILNTDPSKNLEYLNNIPYLLNLKNDMFDLFNNFAKYVQDNGALIGSKDHRIRKLFFMKVVHFQFLYFEIQAYFPNGNYSPTNVKISKVPAKSWWEKKFSDNIFVDLELFVIKFKEDFPFVNQAEILSFKNSINFTSTTFTTTFEYDLFTRLYSPWEKLTEVWRIIYSHPAYLHFSTYGDTKDTLSNHINEPGTYVFRISCKDLGFWTIGYVKSTKEMGQVKVDKSNLIEALVEGNKKNMYLFPNGESTNPDLTNLNEFRKEIVVNNEDLQLYDCFEDFKECKICRESEKDLQLESCGHQICQSCYKLLRKYDKKVCPFCNQKILSTTKIVNIKDPSVYVDASCTKSTIHVDNHYMIMTSDPSKSNNEATNDVNMRSHDDSRSNIESMYSNMSDEGSPTESAPTVPPRIIHETKIDIKKPLVNYPAMVQTSSKHLPLPKPNESQEKHEKSKMETPSNSIYSEMTSSTSWSNNNANMVSVVEDDYTEITEPPKVNNTLPLSKKPQFNTRIDSIVKEMNNNIMKKSSLPNFPSTSFEEPMENLALKNDDVYCCPIEVSRIYPTIPDDIYIMPVEIDRDPYDNQNYQNFPNSIANVDDIYCNPEEQFEHFVETYEDSDDIFSLWNKSDVERALRVARDDAILAKEILMEFVEKK